MKIFVLGLGKSGTTALVYKIAGGLPDCHAFSGGRPGKYLGDYENAVYKHIFEEKKGKSFELYTEHLSKEHYDRYIWIARDPRDAAVSRMLYRWHKGFKGNKKQYQAHLQLVLKKEKDPKAIPFYEICRYTGDDGWPISKEEVFKEEQVRHRHVCDFVQTLRSEWFLFTYEEMVSKSYAALNDYLGFEVEADAEVPISTGKSKVIRKKAIGDWRHWFTEQDVELFKPIYAAYMELIGYDCQDWSLQPNPVIEPEYSSMYMQRLVRRKSFPSFLSYKDRIIKRLTKG